MVTVEFIYRSNPAVGVKATFDNPADAARWARWAHGPEYRPGTRYDIKITREKE